jgi:hypothetical protein
MLRAALREITNRAAEATTDIGNMMIGFDGQSISNCNGGLKPAGMKMINRRRIIRRQCI